MEIINISKYTIKDEDKFIFDTNVLVHLNSLLEEKEWYIEPYSEFFNQMLENGVYPKILLLNLGETHNLYLSKVYNNKSNNYRRSNTKKDFRKSEEGKAHIKHVNAYIESILPITEKINDNFERMDIEKLLNITETFDFNDNCIAEIAQRNNLIIVTHDSDFSEYSSKDIKVLTCNPRLLNP